MSIKYNLTATEILQTLGYTEHTGKVDLENFERENNIKIPSILFGFLSLRADIPLMETSDIWCSPYFSYEDIEERIEEDKEYWEENPDEREDDEFYEISQIPKDQWPERVSNYLQIGSDYAAGVVNYGICINDLEKDNPPVYYLHEEDPLYGWKILHDTLSEFLMYIMGDVIACHDYDTAKDVLKENGWNYQATEYATPEAAKKALAGSGIDLDAMQYEKPDNKDRAYARDNFYCSCYNDETQTLYMINSNCIVYELTKGE